MYKESVLFVVYSVAFFFLVLLVVVVITEKIKCSRIRLG